MSVRMRSIEICDKLATQHRSSLGTQVNGDNSICFVLNVLPGRARALKCHSQLVLPE